MPFQVRPPPARRESPWLIAAVRRRRRPARSGVRGARTSQVPLGSTATSVPRDERHGQRDRPAQRERARSGVGQVRCRPATTATGFTLNPVAGSTLNFASGETTKTIAVTITDNTTLRPPNKKIVLKLSNPSPGSVPAGPAKTTLTILDNDGPGTIDFSSDHLQRGRGRRPRDRHGHAQRQPAAQRERPLHDVRRLARPRAPADYTASSGDSRSASARCPRPSRCRSPTTRTSRATRARRHALESAEHDEPRCSRRCSGRTTRRL